MWRVMQMLAWRSSQPALIRWLEASALFGVALAARFWLGTLHGAVPFLTFYPAILIAALVLGWKEATFVLVLSLSAGSVLLFSSWHVVATHRLRICWNPEHCNHHSIEGTGAEAS